MKRFDVQVLGAGIVGQSLALALARAGFTVALRPEPVRSATAEDVRAYALNAASGELLRSLKVWDSLPAHAATPVRDMHVQGDAPNAALDFSAWQQRVDALAWITDAAVLERELAQAVRFAPHISLVDAEVESTLTALCEGKASATRAALGVKFERHNYGHTAIAARLTASRKHQGLARQWFGSPDVLALLPFDAPEPEHSYALVWSLPEARAKEMLALDASAFEAQLMFATSGAAGELKLASQRAAWPLMLARAHAWAGPGWVLLGRRRARGAPARRSGAESGPGRCGGADPGARGARILARARRRKTAAPLCARAARAHLGDGPGHRRPVAPFFTPATVGQGTSQPWPDSGQPTLPAQALAHPTSARLLKAFS